MESITPHSKMSAFWGVARLLDEDDEACLERHGLMSATPQKVFLDPRVAYREDYPWTEGSPSPPEIQEPISSPAASDYYEYPRFIGDNTETLMYLGFTQARAEAVTAHADRLRQDFPEMGVNWLEVAVDDATNLAVPDVGSETDDWWPTFDNLGLSHDLYRRIMDPEFEAIRNTQTARFWIRDTIEIRWGQLLMIQECSRKRGDRARLPDNHQSPSAKEQKRSEHSKQSINGHAAPNDGASSSSATLRTTDDDEEVPEGYIALWKGLPYGRIQYDVDHQTVMLEWLGSRPPTDFSGSTLNQPHLYFAQDRAVALKYATYAKIRMMQPKGPAGEKDVVLIRLLVEKTWVQELRRFVEGDDWKKVVFLSRNRTSLKHIRARELGVSSYDGAPLLVGRISEGVGRGYKSIRSWSEVTNAHMMKVPSSARQYAIQWAFMGSNICVELQERAIIKLFFV